MLAKNRFCVCRDLIRYVSGYEREFQLYVYYFIMKSILNLSTVMAEIESGHHPGTSTYKISLHSIYSDLCLQR
jgi:hypothetical protein